MKLYFNSDYKLENNIEIKKLGVIFRPITQEEALELFYFFRNNIANASMIENVNFYMKRVKTKKFDFTKEEDRICFEKYNAWLDNLPDDLRECYWHFVLKSPHKNDFSRNKILNRLLKLNVVDIDEKVFIKIYPLDYSGYFMSRLTSFSYFMNSKELFVDSDKKPNILISNDDLALDRPNIIANLFLKDSYYKIDVDYNFLEKIAYLMNKKEIYFCFHLVSIIDALYDNVSIENNIINKVSVIERLIINGNEGIEKQFILKSGIILKTGKFKNIKDIEKQLKTIYNVRSYLVHGNEKLLFEQLKEIGDIFGVNDLSKDKYNNKKEVLISLEIFLSLFLKDILSVYITNTDFCEYLKNN